MHIAHVLSYGYSWGRGWQWRRSVVKSGARGQSGQAIELSGASKN